MFQMYGTFIYDDPTNLNAECTTHTEKYTELCKELPLISVGICSCINELK